MGISETKDAINAAHKAQKSWAAKTGKERSSILKTFYELMMANACLLYTSPSPRDS